jgi:signal transduction histidine kinase/CheY-like chemotaxis protein
VLRRNEFVEREETFLLPNGARVCHSIKFPLLDESGAAYALGAIAIDITERKKTDDALKIARLEAERANRAKSEFLSRMSHDLRTPLNAILGFAQLLDAAGLGEDGQESVDQILRGGKHLLELINEVLDIARIEAGHLSLSPEPIRALEVVQQIVELVRPLASRRGIVTEVVVPESGDVIVAADRQRLNQILMNLVSNALKYNRPNGRVTIAFVPAAAGRVRIAVTDTGAGIPPAKLSLLFQPFERLGAEQTDVEGTGLGLAVARGLAEAMGGSLGVESRVDAGTTFWIELAVCEASEPRHVAAAQVVPDTSAETAGLVLYIEDNSSNVRLMQRVLQRRPGVRLLHAPGGISGLEQARQEPPDLIFLDMHLPDMSGEDVLLHLWQDAALRHIPVVILSADATPVQVRRLKAAGAIEYLTKPLEVPAVLKLLDDRLRGVARVHEHADRK